MLLPGSPSTGSRAMPGTAFLSSYSPMRPGEGHYASTATKHAVPKDLRGGSVSQALGQRHCVPQGHRATRP